MYALSVNEITEQAISVLAFQQTFHFIHRYWCYELIGINTLMAGQRIYCAWIFA